MLTQDQILQQVESGRDDKRGNNALLDGRDYSRLISFFPVEQWDVFGFAPKEGTTPPAPKPLTKEAVLEQLASDLSFAFEKALGQRGISSRLMYEVIKMWMWVLEDDLQHHDEYAQYGLPLYKAVAIKFGLPNEIGDDSGAEESKYGTYA